jgi:hypothetical protein
MTNFKKWVEVDCCTSDSPCDKHTPDEVAKRIIGQMVPDFWDMGREQAEYERLWNIYKTQGIEAVKNDGGRLTYAGIPGAFRV